MPGPVVLYRNFGERCGRTLRAEELAGDVESLAAHNDDLLAVQQLLGDSAGQAAEQMALAVNAVAIMLAKRIPGVCARLQNVARRPSWFFMQLRSAREGIRTR